MLKVPKYMTGFSIWRLILLTVRWYSFIFIVTVCYYIGLFYELWFLLCYCFVCAAVPVFVSGLLCHNTYNNTLFSPPTQDAVEHTIARDTTVIEVLFKKFSSSLNFSLLKPQYLPLLNAKVMLRTIGFLYGSFSIPSSI